jgi:hypothetical protein
MIERGWISALPNIIKVLVFAVALPPAALVACALALPVQAQQLPQSEMEAVPKAAALGVWMILCPDQARARADRIEKYLLVIGVVTKQFGEVKFKAAVDAMHDYAIKDVGKFCETMTASLDAAETPKR